MWPWPVCYSLRHTRTWRWDMVKTQIEFNWKTKACVFILCLFLLSRVKFIIKGNEPSIAIWLESKMCTQPGRETICSSQAVCLPIVWLQQFLLYVEVERDTVAQTGFPAWPLFHLNGSLDSTWFPESTWAKTTGEGRALKTCKCKISLSPEMVLGPTNATKCKKEGH